jgi:hypothetical protein
MNLFKPTITWCRRLLARLRSDFDRPSQSLILRPGKNRGYWNESKRIARQTIVEFAVDNERASEDTDGFRD